MRIGGGEHTYRWIDNWVTLPDTDLGRKDKAHHGVVVTEAGHIVVFHEGGPAVLAYAADGVLQGSWDSELTNAHGMTLVREDGAEYLWMADNKSGQVVKTTLDGQMAGNYLGSINGEEGQAGRFAQPHGVWIGTRRSGPELYISDRANGRVQVYDTDGNVKRVFGSGFLNPRSPSGFAALGDLMIVVELRAPQRCGGQRG